jgi:hypothetical protein
MASMALHASWRKSTSCGVGWICRETSDTAIAITLAAALCTPLPHACPKIQTRRGAPGSERRRRPSYRRIVPAGLGAPYPTARSVSLVLKEAKHLLSLPNPQLEALNVSFKGANLTLLLCGSV